MYKQITKEAYTKLSHGSFYANLRAQRSEYDFKTHYVAYNTDVQDSFFVTYYAEQVAEEQDLVERIQAFRTEHADSPGFDDSECKKNIKNAQSRKSKIKAKLEKEQKKQELAAIWAKVFDELEETKETYNNTY